MKEMIVIWYEKLIMDRVLSVFQTSSTHEIPAWLQLTFRKENPHIVPCICYLPLDNN